MHFQLASKLFLSIRKTIYSSLIESHLRFGALKYGLASPKLLQKIAVLQRKAIRLVARTKYNSHTDVLFRKFKFLKHDYLIQLNQCIFICQYCYKQLPKSFDKMFQYLPPSEQVLCDHDYNFQQKNYNKKFLCQFPIVQILNTWNSSHLLIKAEADITLMKTPFIAKKLSTYEEECLKQYCYTCKRI